MKVQSLILLSLAASVGCALPQTSKRVFQTLHIPPAISGKDFQLTLRKKTNSFWAGATTNTYAYNDERFWGPTLIMNRGETVTLNVKNELDEPTTTHWHGFHIPAKMDGGPHQVIDAGKTWSPSFKVMNNAGTYWYHPHAHETTQKQLTMGAGGLIIIKDPAEAKLALPRTYGVDDIPLVLTSRRFYMNNQFSYEGDNDKYGDYLLANGTMDPKVSLPAQMVRLRILNAEVERGYQFGFPDNRTFWVIATDGGLVEKPIPVQRMKLMVGERVEILVDLSKDKIGSNVDLMSYNADQPFGFPGGEPGTGRPNGGYLNNLDFRVIRINPTAPTANAITTVPAELTKHEEIKASDATVKHTINITGGRPFFSFDDKPYKMHEVSHTIKLGTTETWTVVNNQIFGHAFHVHDVQFKIVARSSGPVEEYEKGWKDTMYVPRGEWATFVAKFDDFASDTDAFMFHCHMSNHEDGGLMGEFLVVKDPSNLALRDRQVHPVTAEMAAKANATASTPAPTFDGLDVTKPTVLFFIQKNCPCSTDATPYLNRIQAAYAGKCDVVGVIDADAQTAKAWAAKANCKLRLISDPGLNVIKAYRAESSVYTTLIAPGGKIVKTYPGYGKEMLNELSAKIAKVTGVAKRAIDLAGAPNKTVAGCPFNFSDGR